MDNKKFYLGIKSVDADSSDLELYFTDFIFDGIDWNTWEETHMVQDMIDKITAAKPSNIKVTINSLGGDVMIGLAIYNFLKNYNASVEVEIIGFAASIASIIAMSASNGKLKIAKNGFMIIHSASTGIYGNSKELRDQAELLDKISTEMADIYALRSGKEVKFFTDLWSDGGDVWLTGSEAKEMGLADETMNAVVANAKVNLEAFGFKNVPTKIISSLQKTQELNMAFTKTITASKAEGFSVVEGGFLLEENQLNNIEAALTAAEASEVMLATANASIATANAAHETITAELATANAANATQAARIAALEAEVVALGKKPSGTGTALASTKDENADGDPVPVYLDDNSPENKWFDNQVRFRK